MKFIIRNLLFLSILFGSSASFSASKNKETYEYLDLFGKVFDRVRSEYVEEVTDQELIEKAMIKFRFTISKTDFAMNLFVFFIIPIISY